MRKRAFTLVELTLIVVLIALIIVLLPKTVPQREKPMKVACASNLKQIYTSLVLYSQDYDGVFPLIDLQKGNLIGEDAVINNRIPGGKENAFKDIPADAGRSVSQNLWLLVRCEFAQPDIFLCPNSEQAGEKCKLLDNKGDKKDVGPECFVNFTFEKPGMTISYSFVQPWSVFNKDKNAKKCFWSADLDPRLAVGADANNNTQPNYSNHNLPLSYDVLKKYVNSTNHNYSSFGQNVVYGDGHVSFEKSAYVGVNQDNIYTAQPADFNGEAGKTPGILSVKPGNEFDSVLVPNREDNLKNWNRKP
jgi:competence protein ComGC